VTDCRKGICLKCTNNLVFDGAVWLHSLAKRIRWCSKTSLHEEHIKEFLKKIKQKRQFCLGDPGTGTEANEENISQQFIYFGAD